MTFGMAINFNQIRISKFPLFNLTLSDLMDPTELCLSIRSQSSAQSGRAATKILGPVWLRCDFFVPIFFLVGICVPIGTKW